ncbi:MAG: efflux RND transporter periplasmic adaptor subunit [Candidatus Delongbacteria bacterium]
MIRNVARPFPVRLRHFSVLLLSSLALLTGACQVQTGRGESNPADSNKVQPVPVELETVVLGSMASRLHLNGVLTTEGEIKVYPLVAGHVGRLRVEEGDRVRRGDTLLVLEDAEILLSERRLRLEMEKAAQDLERVRQLAEARLVPEQDLSDAQYLADKAKLAWESARLTVQRSRVTAPVGGVVGRRLVQQGDFVQPGSQLFTLVDDRELISVLDVPERDLVRLRQGQSVDVTPSSGDGSVRQGWIKRISPVVDPASGTLRVTVGVKDSGSALRAGMYARFSILTDTRNDVVVVPKRALVYDRDLSYVWVAGDSSAVRRQVERGYEDEERLEVRQGLQAGEALVVVGQSALKPGSPIRVVRRDGRDLPQPADSVKAGSRPQK